MYHYLYKIINLINGNFYYGIHSTNNLDDGYMGSGSALNKSYEKFGIENFKKEILKFRDTREEISSLEKEIVNEDLINNPCCYNIKLGGEDGWTTMGFEKIHNIFKNIEHQKGEKNSNYGKCWITNGEENKKIKKTELNLYINNGWTKGRKMDNSFSQKVKKSSGTKGKIFINNGFENKLISENKINDYITNGWKQGCLKHSNKKIKKTDYLSIDTIKEDLKNGLTYRQIIEKNNYDIAVSTLKRFLLQNNINNEFNFRRGEKNPQYGKCWITNGEENKIILKEELEQYINDGWKRGITCETPELNKLNVDDVISDINNGLTGKEIAKKYNVKFCTYRDFLYKNGLVNIRIKK